MTFIWPAMLLLLVAIPLSIVITVAVRRRIAP